MADVVKGGKDQLEGKLPEWRNSMEQIVYGRTKNLGGLIVGENNEQQLINGETETGLTKMA